MSLGNHSRRTPRLFINYRSEDTGPTASRLFQELTRQFKADQVFLDHERIEGGANWPDRLRREVAQATLMFVLIGNGWLIARDPETGDLRLNIPEDWVRQEIETALGTETEIVPILVEGASPPSRRALQNVPSISRLADQQGLPLRRRDWEKDFDGLRKLLFEGGFKLQREIDRDRNELKLLNKEKNRVEAKLKKVRYNEVLIPPRIVANEEAVDPWEPEFDLPDQNSRILPEEEKIGEIFDKASQIGRAHV